MRKFLHLFFTLLLPMNLLFILSTTLYFSLDYTLIQSIRLGVLFGFFIALSISFFIAILLHMIRQWRQPNHLVFDTPKRRLTGKNQKQKRTKKKKNTSLTNINQGTEKEKVSTSSNYIQKKKILLLMDYALAFEVVLNATEEEQMGILTSNKEGEGHISLNTVHEHIFLSILSLTKHTTQVLIESQKNSEGTRKIIQYLKQKELSLLKY